MTKIIEKNYSTFAKETVLNNVLNDVMKLYDKLDDLYSEIDDDTYWLSHLDVDTFRMSLSRFIGTVLDAHDVAESKEQFLYCVMNLIVEMQNMNASANKVDYNFDIYDQYRDFWVDCAKLLDLIYHDYGDYLPMRTLVSFENGGTLGLSDNPEHDLVNPYGSLKRFLND